LSLGRELGQRIGSHELVVCVCVWAVGEGDERNLEQELDVFQRAHVQMGHMITSASIDRVIRVPNLILHSLAVLAAPERLAFGNVGKLGPRPRCDMKGQKSIIKLGLGFFFVWLLPSCK